MFFFLFIILSGLNIYRLIRCENNNGFLAKIFRKPLLSIAVVASIFMTITFVSGRFVLDIDQDSPEGGLILISNFFVCGTLFVMLIEANFSKTRIVNIDNSVTIRNKGGLKPVITALLLVAVMLLVVLGGNTSFLWLFSLITGVNIYYLVNCENNNGFLAKIFKRPIKSLCVPLIVLTLLCIVVAVDSNYGITDDNQSIVFKYIIGYGIYICLSLIFMFLISNFSKTRIVNSDNSVTIKNKARILPIFGIILLIICHFFNVWQFDEKAEGTTKDTKVESKKTLLIK